MAFLRKNTNSPAPLGAFGPAQPKAPKPPAAPTTPPQAPAAPPPVAPQPPAPVPPKPVAPKAPAPPVAKTPAPALPIARAPAAPAPAVPKPIAPPLKPAAPVLPKPINSPAPTTVAPAAPKTAVPITPPTPAPPKTAAPIVKPAVPKAAPPAPQITAPVARQPSPPAEPAIPLTIEEDLFVEPADTRPSVSAAPPVTAIVERETESDLASLEPVDSAELHDALPTAKVPSKFNPPSTFDAPVSSPAVGVLEKPDPFYAARISASTASTAPLPGSASENFMRWIRNHKWPVIIGVVVAWIVFAVVQKVVHPPAMLRSYKEEMELQKKIKELYEQQTGQATESGGGKETGAAGNSSDNKSATK